MLHNQVNFFPVSQYFILIYKFSPKLDMSDHYLNYVNESLDS